MPCHSTLTQPSAGKHVQAVTTVDDALLGTHMDASPIHDSHRLPVCFVTAVVLLTVSHHVLQEAKARESSSAVWQCR